MFGGRGYWFIVMYLVLYCMLPLLNAGIKYSKKEDLLRFIMVFVVLMSILPYSVGQIINLNDYGYSKLVWMVLVYCIGAYIRLYPPRIANNIKVLLVMFVGILTTISTLRIGALYIVYSLEINMDLFILVSGLATKELNGFLALILSVTVFMLIKQIDLGSSKLISKIGVATFGVYLIHDHRNFREFMWIHMFRIPEMYTSPWFGLYIIIVIFSVFIACTVIELIRYELMEKHFFHS